VRAWKFALMAAASLGCNPDEASAASFPCEKAGTAVEKMICANPALSELDEHLGRYYSAGRAELGTAKTCLASNQKEWLRAARNSCKDTKCLESAYLARLAELDALQPGMTAIKNIELPRVKSLVWIIPAAEDTVAAPPNTKGAPLVVQGKIVDDIAGGDGFVIQDKAGRKHLLLALMFIDKPSSVALESLIGSPAVYEARGRAEASSDSSVHFAPGACTFIYRLP
jgi:uncharacterized protein